MNDRKSMSEIAADLIDPSAWPLLHNDPTLEEFEFMSQSLELSSVNDEWLSTSDPFSDFNFDNFDMLFADPDFLVAHRLDNHNSENADRNSRSNRNPNLSANPSPTYTNYESDFLATGQEEQQTPSPSSSREFFSSQTSAPTSPWSQHSSVGSPLSTQPDSPLGLNTSENSFDFRTLLSKSNFQVSVEQTPNKPQPKEKGKRGRPPKKNLDRRIQKGKRTAIISPEILEESMVRLSHTNHTNTSCSNSSGSTATTVAIERKKRKCMTDDEKKIHNELERRRRAAMSVRLAHLKDSVEKIRDDPKASTKKIVDEAIVAIEDCKFHEQELLIEKQNLADHRRRLKARIQSMENGTDSFTSTPTEMDSGLSEDEHISVV